MTGIWFDLFFFNIKAEINLIIYPSHKFNEYIKVKYLFYNRH